MSDEPAEPDSPDEEWVKLVEYLARETAATVAEDVSGPGLLVLHVQELAEHMRCFDFDAACLSLDAIEGMVEEMRERLDEAERAGSAPDPT